MKLPEAIALMLEGKVMATAEGDFWRVSTHASCARFEFRCALSSYWADHDVPDMPLDGWREATPEELKEIGA